MLGCTRRSLKKKATKGVDSTSEREFWLPKQGRQGTGVKNIQQDSEPPSEKRQPGRDRYLRSEFQVPKEPSDLLRGFRRQVVEVPPESKKPRQRALQDFAFLDGEVASEGERDCAPRSTNELRTVCHMAPSPRRVFGAACAIGGKGTTPKSTAHTRAFHVGAGRYSSALQKRRCGFVPCGIVRHVSAPDGPATDVRERRHRSVKPFEKVVATESGSYDETVTLDGTVSTVLSGLLKRQANQMPKKHEPHYR